MSGRRSREKGKRGEREVVALAQEHGLAAERTWQTSQAPDPVTRACDVRIGGDAFQVKRERNGFERLYRDLEHVAGLLLRADGREWIAVVPAKLLFTLLKENESARSGGGESGTVNLEGGEG